MTFDKSWAKMLNAHPQLKHSHSHIEITAPELRKLLEQFYNFGARDERSKRDFDGGDFFGSLFGGLRL